MVHMDVEEFSCDVKPGAGVHVSALEVRGGHPVARRQAFIGNGERTASLACCLKRCELKVDIAHREASHRSALTATNLMAGYN